jgi:hypothetical protein
LCIGWQRPFFRFERNITMLACEDAGPGIAPLFIGTASDRAEIERQEDEDAAHDFSERDFRDVDFIAFCAQARACALVPLSDAELICAYSRHTYSQQQKDENDEWAERDRLDERQRIAGEAAEYTSGISSHVAFRKAHDFLDDLEQKSKRTYHVAEFAADLNIAAAHALRSDPVAWAFYCLVIDGAAHDIPAHVLARSQMWYQVRSQVGDEIIRRGLLNGYFSRKRKGRARA